MNHCPPGPQVFQWGRFKFFRQFALIFVNECLSTVSTTSAISCSPVSTTSANNPCHRFSVIAGVVDTSDKFIAGDNDTHEQLSLVTTTPAKNFLPVTRSKGPWGWEAAKDIKKLRGLYTTADGVIGTTMKSCIHRCPTHPDQRPLRPPKLNIPVLVCSSLGGLRGLLSRCAPMNDTFGGRVRLRRPEISLICPDLQKEETSVVNTVYHW
jgi:hypothetical protein